jgi:hypothetical protein
MHVAKNAELESLVKSQTRKVGEMEAACADLKHEKEGEKPSGQFLGLIVMNH